MSVIHDEIANEIKTRSRYNWLGKKSNKFFLNLGKYRASLNTIRKVIHDAKEITDQKVCIFLFKETSWRKKTAKWQ